MNAKTALLTAGILMTAMVTASPAALAQNQDMRQKGGNWQQNERCENFRDGKGKFSKEYRAERQAEMQKRHAEMADRLKLTDEQRETWDEIHQERKQKHQERMGKWQQKMEKRCADIEK
ncbi:Spy/CpxP family protein refolding chaperone [Marinobacter sp. SS5-14b]|uniref:Spy/CpxP family protein refolding chaperone n=1 Tax=Marinobacter sp. SS5-14b TaxID=3050456 RepID=UPI0026DEABC8|nr:Spy/CpxP family protein refolding chaperone [Marinobacter sp. SS5-14b]